MLLIIIATFCGLPTSAWHVEVAQHGWLAWIREHLLTFEGLDDLLHADTMLFILGLTYFVAVVAQSRLLEGITSFLLQRYRGAILPTIISVTAVVAVVSGLLGGVSMIGLTIRTLVIILLLAAAPRPPPSGSPSLSVRRSRLGGISRAYGEPPNLIMKANLAPNLSNAFFLIYCGPIRRSPPIWWSPIISVGGYAVEAYQRGNHGRRRHKYRGRAIPSGDAAR